MSRLEPGYLPISSGVLPAVVMCCRSRQRSQRKRDARPAGIAAVVWVAARLEGGARPAGVEVAAVPVGGGRARAGLEIEHSERSSRVAISRAGRLRVGGKTGLVGR